MAIIRMMVDASAPPDVNNQAAEKTRITHSPLGVVARLLAATTGLIALALRGKSYPKLPGGFLQGLALNLKAPLSIHL
jgi:hypothetical protein